MNCTQFWLLNVQRLNDKGSALKENTVCSTLVCTDASGTGYGGFVDACVTSLMEKRDVGLLIDGVYDRTSTNAPCVSSPLEGRESVWVGDVIETDTPFWV